MAQELSVAVADGQVAVRDHGGDGPALLLTHAPGWSLATWDLLVDQLTPRFRIVSHDLRGHGRTTAPAVGAGQAWTDLTAIIDTLHLGPTVALGHDLGAYLTVLAAIHRPDLVRATIALDGHATLDRHDTLNEYAIVGDPQFEASLQERFSLGRVVGSPTEVAAAIDRQLEVDAADWALQGSDPASLVRDLERGLQELPGGRYMFKPRARDVLTLYDIDPLDDLFPDIGIYAHLARPHLALFCRLGMFGDGYDRLAATALDNPLMRLIPLEAGHMAHHSHPREVARYITRFIDGL